MQIQQQLFAHPLWIGLGPVQFGQAVEGGGHPLAPLEIPTPGELTPDRATPPRRESQLAVHDTPLLLDLLEERVDAVAGQTHDPAALTHAS